MNLPLNIDLQQVFLHLFNFAILAVGLYFLLYNPIKKYIQKRKDYYTELDSKANEKLASAEKLNAEYNEKLIDADEEIRRLKDEAAKKLEADTIMQQKLVKEQSEKILSDAKISAVAEKEKILSGAQTEISDMIITAAEKLMLKNSGADNDKAIYEQFLNSVEEEDSSNDR